MLSSFSFKNSNFFVSFFYNLILILPKYILFINLASFINFDIIFVYFFYNKDYSFFFKFLKYSSFLRFNCCVDLTAVDNLSLYLRFSLFYNFLSLVFNKRLCLFFKISEFSKVNSMHLLFSSLNWLEREVYDMFGIFFINHYGLKRILTDYGFNSYPLRKDFPCSGLYELTYSSYSKQIRKFSMYCSFSI